MTEITDYATEQETFWASDFGDAYTERNSGANLLAANTALFSTVLAHVNSVNSVLEFGANRGMNLVALQTLLPDAKYCGLEINETAYEILRQISGVNAVLGSMLDEKLDIPEHDLVLVKGVLIHVNPDALPIAYERIFNSARRYICLAEYYNPVPVSTPYRHYKDRLFKRDFAGEMLDRYSSLKLVGYGFRYHRDPLFPLDDITWFLLEKCP